MIIICNFHFGLGEKGKTSWGWTVATKDLVADWVTVLCFENWIKKNQNVHEYLSLTFVSKNETLLEQTANK